MAKCDVCGNEYARTIEIRYEGRTHTFDSFECAIHMLAPKCKHCECRVIGHGIEAEDGIYCCANCARMAGHGQAQDNVTRASVM